MRVLLCLASLGILAACFPACGLDSSGLGDGDGIGDGGLGGSLNDVALGGGSSSGVASSSGSGSSSGGSSGSTSSSGGGSTSSSGGSSSSGSSSSSGASSSSSSGSSSSGSSSSSSSSSGSSSGDASVPCNASSGCYTIPSGWTLVAFAPSQGTACPNGFATASPTEVVEGPNTTNACACGTCSVGTQPTCAAGAIATFYDIHGPATNTCGLPANPAQLGNNPAGACDTDLYKGNEDGLDLKFVAPGASGGQCTSAGQATGNITYASQDRVCTADNGQAAGCNGNQCTPNLAAPYLACVAQTGAVSCPAGSAFTQQHTVGTSVTLTCSACGCNVSATCGGHVALFTDNACKNGETDIAADSQCHAGPAAGTGGIGGTDFGSYEYVADAPSNVACASTGTSTAGNVALTSEGTICCVP